jgi:uncharacterized protein (DUF58 family)
MLLLMGMVFGASLWVLAGITVAGVISVNYFLAQAWTDTAIVTRIAEDAELKIGSLVPMRLEIRNHGKIPILWLLVEDLLPPRAEHQLRSALVVEGERLAVMLIMPGRTETLEYSIRCVRRGYYQIGPTVLETGDLMGLYRRYRVGTQPIYLTVLPDVTLLTGYDIGSRRPIGEIRMRDNVMDDPTRLRGIRQWLPGDPMRSVHWGATARTGALHTKVYEPSSIVGATIVLDFHVSTMPVEHEPVRSDLAVAAAASIAQTLHDSGEPFGLATNGRDAADRIRTEGWIGDARVRDVARQSSQMQDESDRLRPVLVPASRGPVQLKEVIRTLARLERTDGLTLPEMIAESQGRLSNESTLLFIVQRCPPESLSMIIGLARRGWAVAVIVNTLDINDYGAVAGPLIAEHIPTFHLSSGEALSNVCRAWVMR